VGGGQIGSRHAQALSRLHALAAVHVVGRSVASIERLRARYESVASPDSPRLECSTDLATLPASVDLVIVATNSDVRASIVRRLLDRAHVRWLILEKVVFQSEGEFADIVERCRRAGVRAWVNCWRRAVPDYRDLAAILRGDGPVTMHVSGGDWGLGCNAIHFLDYLAFVTGSGAWRADESTRLDPVLLPSRRTGFLEFTGTLGGTMDGGHRFFLTSSPDSGAPLSLAMWSRNAHVVLPESAQMAQVATAENRWCWTTMPARIPLQSELTDVLVREILDRGESDLPTLEQSWALHGPLLKVFSDHIERLSGARPERCPVT
jgi:hypothetical protein